MRYLHIIFGIRKFELHVNSIGACLGDNFKTIIVSWLFYFKSLPTALFCVYVYLCTSLCEQFIPLIRTKSTLPATHVQSYVWYLHEKNKEIFWVEIQQLYSWINRLVTSILMYFHAFFYSSESCDAWHEHDEIIIIIAYIPDEFKLFLCLKIHWCFMKTLKLLLTAYHPKYFVNFS